jgi:hypothetical protein
LGLSKVLELAKRLPADLVRYHSGRLLPDTDFDHVQQTHATGLSLEETLRNIETSGSFVQINHIERDPEYRALIDECLDPIAPLLSADQHGMVDREGWIFVSSPEAVTPYHMDHHRNFLLQIAGKKLVEVWDPADRNVVSERTAESFHANYSLQDVRYREDLEAKAYRFDVGPGDGVFMAYTAPHMVKNGTERSITLSVTFATRADRRQSLVHVANFALRRLGIDPAPAGESALRDLVKHQAARAYLNARRLLRRAP